MNATERPLMAVVPARGASRGIPRKALQPLAGKPLLLHAIDTVRHAGIADRIIVSTEDAEIAAFCRLRGVEVIDRPAELAADDVTLGQVLRHAAEETGWDGDILMLQPTCPLISPETIRRFVQQYHAQPHTMCVAASVDPHLFWQNGLPLTERVNRQWLTAGNAVLRETGMRIGPAAFWRGELTSTTTAPLLIPPDEALDIDTPADLAEAARRFTRGKIEFQVTVGTQVGSGHFWRALRLTEALTGHAVRWSFLTVPPTWATRILDDRGVRWRLGCDIDIWPDMIIMDRLDTAVETVCAARQHGAGVVTFEDDGPGARHADLVINEFERPEFAVLRPEFSCIPERPIPEKGSRALVCFGGTDPTGLNQRVASLLAYGLDAEVRVIVGPGAKTPTGAPFTAGRATVVKDAHMAEQMCWADLMITGQGRTVAEAVACGTPVVSLAQNERESRHAKIPGVLYLGLHAAVSDEALLRTVSRLLDSHQLRAEMAVTARRQIDDKGVDRVLWEIERLLKGL